MSTRNECIECGHLGFRHNSQGRCEWGGGKCPCSGLAVRLTEREYEILKLFAAGNTVKEAAVLLNLSVKTIEAHRYNMGVKTGTHKTIEIILLGLRAGLVKFKDLAPAKARLEVRAA